VAVAGAWSSVLQGFLDDLGMPGDRLQKSFTDVMPEVTLSNPKVTGRAENGPCYRSGNASACLCDELNGRGKSWGAAGAWLPSVG